MPTPTLVDGTVALAGDLRERPFMTLGTQVDHGMGVEEALKLSNSNDHVYPVQLYDHDQPNPDGPSWEEVEGVTAVKSNKFGIMGIHGNGYTITQRRDILETAYDITGLTRDDAQIDLIGNIGPKAEKFFASIRFEDLVIDPNGIADTVERRLYVATSYDGSLPNIFGYSNTRIACLNELHMTLKGLQQTIKVRHTRNAEERIKVAAQALQYVGAVEKQLVERAEKMLTVDGDKALDLLLDKFWPVEEIGDLAKTRRLNERGDVRMLYQGDSNTNIDLVGRNGWAAYNAVVEYLDHFQPVKGVKGSEVGNRRAERAVLPGPTVDKKLKASELVLSLS